MRTSKIFSLFSILFILSISFLGLSSCASTDETIPEDMQPAEYFQKAQNIASNQGNYSLAIKYYQTFIDRHPDDLQRIVIAKYEIAFLNYKRDRSKIAAEQFRELLTYYEDEGATVLPKWPKILAEKVLAKIEVSS